MLSNSLIKYFKGLSERSNQISTLLFINTISALGITLTFTANNIVVDSIFFTLLIVHSMCLTITYFYSRTHSSEVNKGCNIINNVMNNEVIKLAINDYDFIYNNNKATKDMEDENKSEDNKEIDESDKESDKSEDGIKEYNSEEYDNNDINDINQEIKPKDEFKLEFAKKKLLGFKAENIRTFTGIKNTQEKIDRIISIIESFDYDIDMKDDKVYYDIKQLIVLFNEIQLSYSYRNAFKPEIDKLFEILELIV